MTNNEKITKGRDRLRVKLRGKKYDVEAFDLMKIPIEWLYQDALREIGEQESYIEELKAEIMPLRKENNELKRTLQLITEERCSSRVDVKELNATQYVLNSNNEEINKLKKIISDLAARINNRENKIKELENQLEKNI